jgi:hypothetical protein
MVDEWHQRALDYSHLENNDQPTQTPNSPSQQSHFKYAWSCDARCRPPQASAGGELFVIGAVDWVRSQSQSEHTLNIKTQYEKEKKIHGS